MFVRVEYWMKERELTAYQVAKAAAILGETSEQAVYRLIRAKGRLKRFDARLLAALCEVFDIDPGELFELDEARPKKRR